MKDAVARVGKWFRPPRNLLILFVLMVCVPAITLIVLGIRLLDQDRELAHQRQLELLDHAADQGVRVLEQDLAARMKRLSGEPCAVDDVPYDAVCIVIHSEGIAAFPPGRIPYYPSVQPLKESPSGPFEELEAIEFQEPFQLDKALELSRTLARASDAAVRAGALLREYRILHSLKETTKALEVLSQLSRIESVSINREPADLLARRIRCALFEEQVETDDFRQEAAALDTDLHSGKWQLDRPTFLHIEEILHKWLGPVNDPDGGDRELLAAGVGWLYEKWMADAGSQSASNGIHVLNSNGAIATIVWSVADGRGAAFIAGPKYLESRWMADFRAAVFPAQAFLGRGEPQQGVQKVQRSAAETELPWTIIVAAAPGQKEPEEFIRRRRNLALGLAALVVLIGAGSYFIWRAVNRELAVATLQSDFVSAVSHEFRTPLTTLRQFTELLTEDDGPTFEKRREYYEAQSRATERLRRLVESLLDFGRMEAGRRPYRFRPLDAAMLARDVTESFVRETNRIGFALQCTSEPGSHPISADAEAMSRAVWNLLDNAVKYSGQSRSVEVRVSRNNGWVSIAVQDHGIGIPASERKKIFQKFVRGAATVSGGIQGTGLGLAMVRHIVEAHGGTLNLQSAESEGSLFTIVLPALSAEGDA